MSNFNKEVAVNYVKVLVDNNRCVTCDLINGPIIRYPCGHLVCNNCAITAENCIRCLSPPTTSSNSIDEPFGQRIKHVSHLLTTFQELFNLDVNKTLRLSEQLKLEKEIFPKCIQAPSKYYNKRKSTKFIVNDKENSRLPLLAGENISKVFNMENTVNYVQQWLQNNESTTKKSSNLPRKPFADLNVNGQSFTKDCSLVTKDNEERVSSRKRTHVKVNNTDIKKKLRLIPKNKKKESTTVSRSLRNKKNISLQRSLCENDDSGFFMDDETIVIDNSQKECIDKDRLALIAVQEADKFESYGFIDCNQSNHNITLTKPTILNKPNFKLGPYKTPFYKKSLLYKICNDCTYENNILQNPDISKSVTVIIDNDKYVTTIKCSHCPVKTIVNKKSVEIQTDTITDIGNDIHAPAEVDVGAQINNGHIILLHEEHIKNADLLNLDIDKNNESISKITSVTDNLLPTKRKCLVIEDSDTESDINENVCTLEATAEVHKEMYDNIGILTSMEAHEYDHRMKREPRGKTPLSTDSSDKENYDPNRMKRQKYGKKKINKK